MICGFVEYSFSPEGRKVSWEKPESEYLEIVRARFAQQGQAERPLDTEALANPRMFFGRTRFHSMIDALPPLNFADTTRSA